MARPYYEHIKRLSEGEFPHLQELAHWMEVTTCPMKWDWIKQDEKQIRERRASRINLAIVDYPLGNPDSGAEAGTPTVTRVQTFDSLAEALKRGPAPDTTRLYVVEDLSRDLVEMLGSELAIDPLFFREHINDFLVSCHTLSRCQRPS